MINKKANNIRLGGGKTLVKSNSYTVFISILFISLFCSVFIKSVYSAPRKSNVKRAANNGKNNKRAASNSSSSKASSKASTKRLAKTSAKTRRNASGGHTASAPAAASASASETDTVSSVSDNMSVSVSSVDTEKLDNILAEIESLKEMFQSQNDKNDEKFANLGTLVSNSKDHLLDLLYSVTGNISANNSASDTTEEMPKHTGEIFKSAEIDLNEGQGYYLADIVNEANLSKYDNTKFYFSRCGFDGDFIVPEEECFDGVNLSASKQVECSRNQYTSYSLGEMGFNPNTSYNLNNTFMNYSDGRNDYPISFLGKYYKSKSGWQKPAGYIRYSSFSAAKCPNYNFVKAVTSNGVEDFVKINIKAVNNIPYITGTDTKVVWTGKVFKSPTLQLKEGTTYKLKDIANLPAYGSKDIYDRTLNHITTYISNCGMTLYDGNYTKEGKLEDLQTEHGYSILYGKEGTLMSENSFSTAYIKVLPGAKDKCKTNFLYVGGARNIKPYTDSTKIEFIK